jgi:hypothetical protein
MTRCICRHPLLTQEFQHLADLLVHADSLTVRACIRDRPPCTVARLATLVYDALPLWAYTLQILSRLCNSTTGI